MPQAAASQATSKTTFSVMPFLQILPALGAALDIEVCRNLAEELEEPESMRAFGTTKSRARATGAIGEPAP
jgi:hypothetical protein